MTERRVTDEHIDHNRNASLTSEFQEQARSAAEEAIKMAQEELGTEAVDDATVQKHFDAIMAEKRPAVQHIRSGDRGTGVSMNSRDPNTGEPGRPIPKKEPTNHAKQVVYDDEPQVGTNGGFSFTPQPQAQQGAYNYPRQPVQQPQQMRPSQMIETVENILAQYGIEVIQASVDRNTGYVNVALQLQ